MSPEPPSLEPTESSTCPGCGAVLAIAGVLADPHPGASPPCTRLFDVTLRGLREDAAEAGAAVTVRLADDAYDAQHPVTDDPDRTAAALARLGVAGDLAGGRPTAWQMTIADVAADLDVIDLPVLVEKWARTIVEDWTAAPALGR